MSEGQPSRAGQLGSQVEAVRAVGHARPTRLAVSQKLRLERRVELLLAQPGNAARVGRGMCSRALRASR